MMRRPPRSTRTDTRFPYTTLCRSAVRNGRLINPVERIDHPREREIRSTPLIRSAAHSDSSVPVLLKPQDRRNQGRWIARRDNDAAVADQGARISDVGGDPGPARRHGFENGIRGAPAIKRSEERRVGKECVSTVRSWWVRLPE